MFLSLAVCLRHKVSDYLTYSDCCDVFNENETLKN